MSAGPHSEDLSKSQPSYTRPLVAPYDTSSRHTGALQVKEFWPSALNTEVKAKHALFECFRYVLLTPAISKQILPFVCTTSFSGKTRRITLKTSQ